MAKIIGESGAWRAIVGYLRQSGLQINHPKEVGPLLSHLRTTFQPSVDRKKLEVAQSVASSQALIDDLHAEKGVWRSILNWFRIRSCESSIVRMHSEERKYVTALSANIQKVDAVSRSTELAGAVAELEVNACLCRLSDEYVVFSDVTLVAERYIYFDGVALISAQIDHLVLGPAGVFVIETKQWSRKFVESGNYHNPFDQIQRAAYLCYDQLRGRFGKIPVRSIIACAGQLPAAPTSSYVKVLAIPKLIGYISWFKERVLSPRQLLKVRSYLEKNCRVIPTVFR